MTVLTLDVCKSQHGAANQTPNCCDTAPAHTPSPRGAPAHKHILPQQTDSSTTTAPTYVMMDHSHTIGDNQDACKPNVVQLARGTVDVTQHQYPPPFRAFEPPNQPPPLPPKHCLLQKLDSSNTMALTYVMMGHSHAGWGQTRRL